MKKKNNNDMLAEYDFSEGVRGKYAARFAQGTNIVVLEPDVAKVFLNSQMVNETLRAVAKIASPSRSGLTGRWRARRPKKRSAVSP